MRRCPMYFEDEHRLILGWEIMWTESDVEMTVPIVTKYTDLYPNIASISFDRGFWSPDNFDAVSGLEVHVILPKKGNKNKVEKERESAQSFKRNVGVMPALSHASTAWNNMAGIAFGRKGVRTGLHERLEQVWLRLIYVA